MSIPKNFITIQCRLIATEETRRSLWLLMAERNTPFIYELLNRVSQHDDFEAWQRSGRLNTDALKKLWKSYKDEFPPKTQPGRFYTSAKLTVQHIYESWLALQKKLRLRLDGKQRWLEMLKSDAELIELSECSLDEIQVRANEILAKTVVQLRSQGNQDTTIQKVDHKNSSDENDKNERSKSKRKLSDLLFEAYASAEDSLSRCAIVHLLKNSCKVGEQAEDLKKLSETFHKKKKEIQRLEEKLACRLPKGRDLTGDAFLKSLETSISLPKLPDSSVEDSREFLQWESEILSQFPILAKKPNPLPYPIFYEINEDLTWSKNEKGRICVKFNGFGQHIFEVYCDHRQLHYFQQFLQDQQTKKASRGEHSTALFLLRSAHLIWREDEALSEKRLKINKKKARKRGEPQSEQLKCPWNVYYLELQCAIDTHFLTAQGTQQIREQEKPKIKKSIEKKEKEANLTENQLIRLKSSHTSLSRLSSAFPRPNKPPYQGRSHILVGVNLGLRSPATVAVVDATTGDALAYRSTRQLLTDDRKLRRPNQPEKHLRLKKYRLLNRYRQRQQCNLRQRRQNQQRGVYRFAKESGLGQQLDRHIAKAIVSLAQEYQASSIVLPDMSGLRERVESEIQARAEQKCGSKEAQKKYAKRYRASKPSWSYDRLTQSIKGRAAKFGISVEIAQQPAQGSPQEKAKDLAIAAYHFRQIALG